MLRTDTWVVVIVGCLECGEPTQVVGVYLNKADADDEDRTQRALHDADENGYFQARQRQILVCEATAHLNFHDAQNGRG